jgi:hypothetical protein
MSRPATPTRKTSSRRHFGHLNESRPKDARSSCGARDIGQAPHCAHFTNTSSTCSGDRSALIFLEPGTALDVPRRYAHGHARTGRRHAERVHAPARGKQRAGKEPLPSRCHPVSASCSAASVGARLPPGLAHAMVVPSFLWGHPWTNF